MKKILLTLLLAAGVAASTRATIIVGTDVGYLFDSKEAYTTGRLGFEFHRAPTTSHQFEVEVGYTETTAAGGEASLLPLTLNYRLASDTGGAWGYYAGLGAGFARTRAAGVSINGPVRLEDESFTAQAFVGGEYRLTPVVAVTAGLRYLWVDDVKLAGTSVAIGDDLAASLGLRFKF